MKKKKKINMNYGYDSDLILEFCTFLMKEQISILLIQKNKL